MPGVGHLNIGIGQGAAQVFDNQPLIQGYAQMLQQRQAKHEAELKQVGDELAKGYDPSGLRNDADRTAYIKQYNDIKQSAIDAENEKDHTKKALALSGVRQQLNDLGSFSAGSKQQGAFERSIALSHLKDRYLLDDDSLQKYMSQKDKVWNDPSVIRDASGFERAVDPEKMETQYQKVNQDLLKHHPATYGTEKIQYGQDVFGRKTATGTKERVIPYQDALEMHLNMATADPNYQKYLHDKYPDIQGLHNQVVQDMKDHGDDTGVHDKPITKDYTAPNEELTPGERISDYHWNLEHNPDGSPKFRQGDTTNPPAEPVSDFPIQYNTAADNGGFPIHVKNFVPLSEANKDFAGTPDIDVTNGGKPAAGTATQGKIVGVGDVPVYGSGKFEGTPAQEKTVKAGNATYQRMVMIEGKDKDGNPAQYMISYDKLPANIKNSKEVREALGKFDKTPVGGQQEKSYKAPNGKTYSHKDLLDLGYTEEQIKQAEQEGKLK